MSTQTIPDLMFLLFSVLDDAAVHFTSHSQQQSHHLLGIFLSASRLQDKSSEMTGRIVTELTVSSHSLRYIYRRTGSSGDSSVVTVLW